MAKERAVEAARRARRALARGDTRDAAWLAIWSTELDASTGLGLAVVARILHEVSGDPLATVGTQVALEMGLPEPEQTEVARFHRIDRWSRGLLAHVGGQALLPVESFSEASAFEENDGHDAWFESRIDMWGSIEDASLALRRLVGALSDAWEMPQDTPEPLRSPEPWPEMPAYAAWKAEDPLSSEEEHLESETDPPYEGVTVISDYWTAHNVEKLQAQGRLAEAAEAAESWIELRPGRLAPRIARMRISAEVGDHARLEQLEREILEIETEDLTELEEARVGLGLLQRYEAQLEVLDRMDRLAPGHPVVLANRGAVRLELNRPLEAEADLQLALELDPESGPALTNLALLRMRESDYVAARGLLEQAKLLHPKEAQVRYYLAACLQNQAHPEAARREAEAAVDLDPGFAPAHMLIEQLRGTPS